MKNNKYNLFFNPFYIFILIIASLLIALAIQFNISFNYTTFERIVYNVINMKNLNKTFEYITLPTLKVSSSFIIILCISIIPLLIYYIYDREKYINIFKKKFLVYPISVKNWSLFLLCISIIMVMVTLNVPQFILNNINYTNLYEDYYVEYEQSKIKFPNEKRNLITIYVESFENSVFSKKNGGVNDESYMPNLEKLTNSYINFSNNDKIGGFYQLNGTGWTAASLVGQTSGVPIYIKTKNKDNQYLDGAITIGEVLEDNGYKNYFLMGSDAGFAERRSYFLQHGNYDITDYVNAIDKGLIHKDYYTWWGFEDRKLYDFAEDLLLEISKKEEPFNFSMLTADTHFYDGFIDSQCPRKFTSNYANSYYCTDLMLSKFLKWIQKQDFYQNTTIIIVGDHLTMRDDFFKVSKGYERTVYNLFINSISKTDNTNNRSFTALDMYPTTLAAIGATIEGDRISLGTNLFSNKKTLMEQFGIDKYEKEISKMSKYYNDEILKS